MIKVDYVAQPLKQTTIHAISNILQDRLFNTINVAAAYATTGGVQDLLDKMKDCMTDNWITTEKRWITSFDYCRTEPVALETLAALPASEVRIFDAQFCLSNGGTPKVPFHPKAYLFSNDEFEYALAGSGNLSRSGLSRGFEAGLSVGVSMNSSDSNSSAVSSIENLRAWYESTWSAASTLDTALLQRYASLYESIKNLKNPTPTEDDVASGDTSQRALSNKDLQKLRVCRSIWIEAGNITKNRGRNLPGNQLMMKRMTRVFFGFDATDYEKNSSIGTIYISFEGGVTKEYSLTYSDNGMDKLVLPIPGSEGPEYYDNTTLIFEITKAKQFNLRICKPKEKPSLIKQSLAIGGAFKMSSGRQWGVF